jgi:hypothetical protein
MRRSSFLDRNIRKNRAANKRNVVWKPRLERLEDRDVPSTVYSIAASGNALLKFDTGSTTSATTLGVSGLLSGEVLGGIAFRTQTDQLFAVALNTTTHVARLGTINVSTGGFNRVGSAGSGFVVTSFPGLALADDPVNDRLHLVTDTGQSLMINPNNASATVESNIAFGNDLAGLAFSNNFKGSTGTVSFAVDASTGQLVIVDLSTGGVTAVGTNLGVGPIGGVAGFTVGSDGTALAVLEVDGHSNLYSINLNQGTATLMGQVSASATVAAGLAIAQISIQVAGSGPGMPATVQVYNSDGSLKMTLHPFEGYTGGVTAAVGDVNGDGIPDIAVGAGGGPRVTVYDGRTGATLANFFAYDVTFSGGVFVAIGDVNGDGKADVITGAAPMAARTSRSSTQPSLTRSY